MNANELLLINKYGQNLTSLSEVLNFFEPLSIIDKRQFLINLANILTQVKPTVEDLDKAVEISNLKKTFTPVVKLNKGLKYNNFLETINLPDNELKKVLVLLLSIYTVAYNRLRIKEEGNPYKWWLQDLSDNNLTNRILSLSNVEIVIRKLYNNNSQETGAIITALLPFLINVFEKDILERQLELYAFNHLYPGQGISIFKENHDDTVSITIIKGINNLPQSSSFISLY